MISETYFAWLREQVEKDKLDDQAGLSPLPRSRDEQQAIFFALPARERRRAARLGGVFHTRKSRTAGDVR
jgi:hypothetical protein